MLLGPVRAIDLLFYIGLLVVALLDLRSRRVSNRVSVSFFGLGLALRLAVGGAPALLDGLAGAGVGFGFLIVPFAFRLVGGADVKVMAALGAWLGPFATVVAAGLGFIVGGVLALLIVLWRPPLRRDVRVNLENALLSQRLPAVAPRARFDSVPHVTAFAVGGALTAWIGWGV